jgi:hypothetical protein
MKGLSMKKLIAMILFTAVAAGSIYGCAYDGRYPRDEGRSDGMRGDRFDRRGEDQRDRVERGEGRSDQDARRDNRY